MAYLLPSRLDTAEAAPLRMVLKRLVEQRQAIVVDGSAVEQAGQGCLQVLAAARAAAAAQGLSFTLQAASSPLADTMALAAIDLSDV